MEIIDQYETYLKDIKGFSNNTIKAYKNYANHLIVSDNDYRKAIHNYTNCSNSTKRLVLSAFKSYLNFVDDKSWLEIKLPKKDVKIQDFISFEEYKTLLTNVGIKSKNKFQKTIILRLFFETGIRASELLNIKITDISQQQILINGKGKKQRYVYTSKNLHELLRKYICDNNIKNNLFDFKYKNLYKKMNLLSKHINKKITPHMFRRGFATYCLMSGMDIYCLSKIMGHSDLNTTKTYIISFDVQEKMQNLF